MFVSLLFYRATYIVKSPSLSAMVSKLATNEQPFASLPAKTLRLLYKAFVLAGGGVIEEAHQLEYWNMVSSLLNTLP